MDLYISTNGKKITLVKEDQCSTISSCIDGYMDYLDRGLYSFFDMKILGIKPEKEYIVYTYKENNKDIREIFKYIGKVKIQNDINILTTIYKKAIKNG